MSDEISGLPQRRSRFWLYAPLGALLALALLWSGAWLYIRNRTGAALDQWLEAEAKAGRQWTCPDRSVAGFPFRIEVSCSGLTFARSDSAAQGSATQGSATQGSATQGSLGRIAVIGQVYDPGRYIAELEGPLRVTQGPLAITAEWRLLQSSLHGTGPGFQRASIVIEEPKIRLAAAPGAAPLLSGDIQLAARHLETHLRPSPAGGDNYDWNLQARGAVIPGLDDLIGGSEPADLDLTVQATQARVGPGTPPEQMERWRAAGGRLNVTQLRLAKGAARLEGNGELGLDAQHRPEGELNLSSARLGGLAGTLTGGSGSPISIFGGAITIRPRAPEPAPAPNAPVEMKPLPPLRIENGRLYAGPFPVPGIRLPPLY